jgi:cytochrome c556
MNKTVFRISAALALLSLAGLLASASGSTTSVIEERQETMEEIGKAMKSLAAIAKQEAPFEVEVVQSSAKAIAEHLEKAADLFPEGSDSGDVETWAKPDIWSDRATFDKDLQDAHDAAVKLAAVTEQSAFMPALGALGNGCKTCHDTFRRPKH